MSAVQLLLTACQDGGQSPPARPDAPPTTGPGGSLLPVDLVYVCGNKFLATNATPSTVQVEYRVAGTDETGGLTLRGGPGGDPGYSETELETVGVGTVELYLLSTLSVQGSRPSISSAPGAVNPGETCFIGTASASTITRVTWIRLAQSLMPSTQISGSTSSPSGKLPED